MKQSNWRKGEEFTKKIVKMINEASWGSWSSYGGCKPTPRSGAIKGWKGDITGLPNHLNRFVIECKFHHIIKIGDWWKQVVSESIQMSKNPMLIFALGDEILVVKRLKDELKEIK